MSLTLDSDHELIRTDVRAWLKQQEEKEDEGWLVRESSYGSFERSLTIPEGVDPAAITASYADGILEVLPGDSLKQREAVLPQLVEQANGNLSELRQILGLAKKGDMPDDIAMLVLSRNLA